ncbi:MAG: DinB family protein [Gemmataceae bacterium]
MTPSDLRQFMEFNRKKTIDLLDAIDKRPDKKTILGWRPGAGRAHIAWQFMHIAATDDRHLYVRMRGGEPKEPDLVKRFAGGSTPDDNIPTCDEIRAYLAERRAELLEHLSKLTAADMRTKPQPEAPWVYEEWFQVLAWHEAHHQGQAHITLNLYRAAQDPDMTKVGH